MSGILTQNSTYIDVYFNTSIIFRGNSNTGSNSYTNQSGSNIKVKNNNFVNFGSGRAYYNDNTNAITESDFNNVFATGINLARWGANEQQSFEDLRSASSKDVNSLSVNPWFLQDGDPGINSSFLDGKGTQISGISTDFFNITRQNPPDIGAAEFSATDQAFSEGTYTIGGDSPDYPTVVDGIAALMERGVSGPVVFNIRPGEYNEHVGYIFKIPGSSAVNTVTVKSETGNPEDVRVYQLTDNTGGAFNVINMKGLEYFTLRDITLSALGNSNGRPLTINGTSKHVSIVNNILTSANTATYCMTVGGVFDDLLIKDNTITKGYGGIYFEASSTRYGTNNEISGNSISGSQYTGIHMRYQFSPHIKNNNILNTLYPGYEGMNIQDCQDELVVTGNRINNQNSDYGIKLINCDATNPFYGLVANNFVRIGFDYEASGIYLDNCTRTFIYHNSVNITSTHTDRGRGIYTSANNSELEIVNNNLACSGQGYAMVLGDLNDAPVIDYNNLYTNGANLVWDNGSVYTDISAWQSANGRDANSISVDPMFNNDSDLHSMQLAFHKAGTPLSEVTVDIDSMPRDPSTPDLGAAEFSCMTPEFNVFVTPVCLGDTTLIIDSTRYIAPGSTRGWDFTGDLVPDVYTDNQYDTVKWVFEEAGSSSITYIVQQIAGCNDFITLDAAVIPEPVLQIETKGAYCDSTDGWASATVTNIEGPFQYFWSNGSTDSLATKLALGLYTVAVADETGCTASEEVTIGEAIEVTFSNLSPSTCGIHDGSATVNAEGGFAPYDYVWSNGYTTATNDSLAPGPHYVNVIDSKGCYSAAALNVDSDGGPQILLSASNNNDCYGEQFGSLDISISSGVAPYDILWSNGETTEDIEGLASGTYNVVVQDAEGCLGAGSFQISQPAQISISPNVTPATCEGSDGSAVAIISGGSRPFIYQWSSGGIYKIEEGLAAGVYSVTVTDAKGCEMVEPVIVNNINAPLVAITDVQGVGCTVTDNGAISVSASPPNPFYSYAWSSGQTTPTINNLTEGTYVITVTDSEGCKGVNQAVVEQEPPDANPICIVSVDTVTGKNMLIWVKENIEDVSHYNIYRESSIKGDYQVIASVDVGEESVYIDEVADPSIRSWRYKLSVVDVCGIESELSLHHKTMHLTMNKGLDGDVNLIWDHYEGFPVNTYKVWRYEPGSGWENITDMPSNLTSYTDKNPPNESLTYFIEVLHPGGCTSSEKKPATLNSARSNRRSSKKSVTPGSVVEELFSDYQFGIYPNPSFGRFNIELEHDNLDKATVKIFDVSGKILEKIEYKDIHGRLDTQLDLSGYTDGMYQVQITTEHLILHRILVKE